MSFVLLSILRASSWLISHILKDCFTVTRQSHWGLLWLPYSVSEVTEYIWVKSGIILGMGSANERRRYNVTSSLIGWAHTQNDPQNRLLLNHNKTTMCTILGMYCACETYAKVNRSTRIHIHPSIFHHSDITYNRQWKTRQLNLFQAAQPIQQIILHCLAIPMKFGSHWHLSLYKSSDSKNNLIIIFTAPRQVIPWRVISNQSSK